MRRASVRHAWLILACLVSVRGQSSDAWFPTPFFGQNLPPESDGPIDVHFSAYLWRITDVNEVEYQFTAQLQYTLSWKDANAVELIENATVRQREAGLPCTRPCNNYNFPAGNPSVQVPVLDTSARCCDDLWLPGLLIDNVVDFSSATYYSRIAPCNEIGGVVWSVKYNAIYFTSMNFVSFPFDKQYLTIIFRPPQDATTAQGKVNIIPSTTAVTTRFNLGIESGDELSSFYIQNMTFDVFEAPWSDVFKTTSAPHPNDSCSFNPDAKVDQEFLSSNYTSISVVIVVQRYSWYFVWTIIVPITLVGLFGFFVFMFPPNDVATRFSSIVTLYLALMAVQYVVNADLPASSYSMPSQQLILATYALYFALAIESFAVYKIVLTKERRDAESKQAEAVEMWKQMQAQQAAEKARLSQYIGLMRSKPSASGWSLRSSKRPSFVQQQEDTNVQSTTTADNTVVQVASSDHSGSALEPEPRRTSVVRFAPDPQFRRGSHQSSVGSEDEAKAQPVKVPPEVPEDTPVGRGWAALRAKGPKQFAEQGESGMPSSSRNPSAASLSSAGGSAPTEDVWEEQDTPWGRPSWIRRRRSTTSMSVATSRGEEEQPRTGQIVGLFGWLRKGTRGKKGKHSKRQSVQDVFYQWRARRYDKIFGSILFICYMVCAVLLFAIPYALYTVPGP